MAAELTGQVPVPYPFAQTVIRRAWKLTQREFLWSFLWGDWAIATPSPVGAGTVTVTYGGNQVIGDATATAAWAVASPGLVSPLSRRQFRVGQGTIYNILSYDLTSNPPFATLTLQSPFVDPLTTYPQQANVGYQILQFYYFGPTLDFLWWESIRDPISGYTLATTMTREEVDDRDPQRFESGWPQAVIPYKVCDIAGDPKFGFPMYEIWPAPLNNYTYVATGFRQGLDFAAPGDTVNPRLGEDVVIARGKMLSYEWALANPDKVPKGDYRFLYDKAKTEHDDLIDGYMLSDEEFSHRHKISRSETAYFDRLPWVSNRNMVMYAP
jgi:hypothetical protein